VRERERERERERGGEREWEHVSGKFGQEFYKFRVEFFERISCNTFSIKTFWRLSIDLYSVNV
jgi:hypothetical protein